MGPGCGLCRDRLSSVTFLVAQTIAVDDDVSMPDNKEVRMRQNYGERMREERDKADRARSVKEKQNEAMTLVFDVPEGCESICAVVITYQTSHGLLVAVGGPLADRERRLIACFARDFADLELPSQSGSSPSPIDCLVSVKAVRQPTRRNAKLELSPEATRRRLHLTRSLERSCAGTANSELSRSLMSRNSISVALR